MSAKPNEPALSIEDRVAALRKGTKEAALPAVASPASSYDAASAAPASHRPRTSSFGIKVGAPGVDPVPESPAPEPAAPAAPSPSVPRPRETGRFAATAGKVADPVDEPVSAATNIAPACDASQPPDLTQDLAQEDQIPAIPATQDTCAQPAPLPDPGEWACETTPPGSAYSEAQWLQAQESNPQCTIFEMIKSEERSLVAVPGLDSFSASLLTRSLVVDLRARHMAPWADKYANARLEHASVEHGHVRYAIIRAASERAKTSYLDGSVLRTAEPGAKPLEETRPRGNRFATAPSGRPSESTRQAGPSPQTSILSGSGDVGPRSGRFAAAIERMRG